MQLKSWSEVKAELIAHNFEIDKLQFAKEFQLTIEEVEICIKWYSNRFRSHDLSIMHNGFGHKNEPYFTEKEMINGYQVPTVEEVEQELNLKKIH